MGSTSVEGDSGFGWLYYFEGVEKLLQVLIGFDFGVAVVFLLYFDIVTALFEQFVFCLCALVHFLHGSVSVGNRKPVPFFGKQPGHPCHRQPWNSHTVGRCVIGSHGSNPSTR